MFLIRVLPFLVCLAVTADPPDWTRWGGPNGNFTIDGKGLAAAWPATGPKQLWRRALGDGYSGIVTDGATLYTMFRRGSQEVVTALDAATGKTRWEYAYAAAFLPRMGMEHGPGPHSTPLLLGENVYTIGILAHMHAFDKKTGKIVWMKDLYKDFPGSTFMGRGYSVSPIAYKNTIIVKLGGHNHAVAALSPKDGSLIWARLNYENAPSTPIIINVDGQDQLVTSFSGEVAGMNPDSGELLWVHPHPTQYGLNISPPVFGGGNIVFVTSAYDGGARGIQLARAGNKTTARELFHTNRMRVHIGVVQRIGDTVYGSSGDFGPAPVTAMDVRTGKVLWQDRTFSKANFLLTGGRALILDEDGVLALATLSPQGMTVHARAQLLSKNAWTAPTLAGTKLYVRDRREIAAFELGN